MYLMLKFDNGRLKTEKQSDQQQILIGQKMMFDGTVWQKVLSIFFKLEHFFSFVRVVDHDGTILQSPDKFVLGMFFEFVCFQICQIERTNAWWQSGW